ncbi:MAG: hypothetical protein KC643_13245 [Nitrospira sp.]|nr:hypothetical protein [Nitrospira sp.]
MQPWNRQHGHFSALVMILIFCCLTLGISPGSTDAQNSDELSQKSLGQSFAFYAYLQSTTPIPSLVAYHPSHNDPNVGQAIFQVNKDSLRKDLVALHPAFNGLVLYAYRDSLTLLIVEQALQLKYEGILLAIWDPNSKQEIDGILALIARYHHRIALAVCVGNEGLTFNRYTLPDLTKSIQALRRRLPPKVHIPICTSEPLYQYANAGLQAIGDFLCPNIHPVFDRPDLGPDEAVKWVRDQARLLSMESRKPVLIKETGFPHAGAPQFTPMSQANFWNTYRTQPQLLILAESSTPLLWVSFAAAFEAFDQPWKAERSGQSMEGAWGLLSVDRHPYPAFKIWHRK